MLSQIYLIAQPVHMKVMAIHGYLDSRDSEFDPNGHQILADPPTRSATVSVAIASKMGN
jgi:hypothetical protein